MATVIERDRPSSVLIERQDSTGWAVAAVVIIAILAVGAFVWARYYSAPAASTTSPGNSINVSVPGGTGGGTTGGNTSQTPTGGTPTQTGTGY